MRDGKKTIRTVAALGLCLGVIGCMALPEALPGWAKNVHTPTPTARACADEVPELRLRDGDVPLVPVPLPPLNNYRDRLAPAPGSTSSPSPPPTSTPSPSSTSPDSTHVVPASHNTQSDAKGDAKTTQTPTSTPVPPDVDVNDVRKLYRHAVDKYAPIDSYIARLTRREIVNGQKKPEEVMLFKFR